MKISIEKLLLDVYIGAEKIEQRTSRRIPVDIRFEYEFSRADELASAIDYREIRDRVLEVTTHQRFHLIEALAIKVLAAVTKEPKIFRAEVVVHKPHALRLSQSVSAKTEWRRRKR